MREPRGLKEMEESATDLGRIVRDSIGAKGSSERGPCEGRPHSYGKERQPAGQG